MEQAGISIKEAVSWLLLAAPAVSPVFPSSIDSRFFRDTVQQRVC